MQLLTIGEVPWPGNETTDVTLDYSGLRIKLVITCGFADAPVPVVFYFVNCFTFTQHAPHMEPNWHIEAYNKLCLVHDSQWYSKLIEDLPPSLMRDKQPVLKHFVCFLEDWGSLEVLCEDAMIESVSGNDS